MLQRITYVSAGKISWDEYKAHFMVEKNFVDKDHAKEHAKHDENLDANCKPLAHFFRSQMRSV